VSGRFFGQGDFEERGWEVTRNLERGDNKQTKIYLGLEWEE